MILKEKLSQFRDDYDGVFECEFCNSFQYHKDCYQDPNFWDNVIPAIRCIKCNKRTNDSLPEERVGQGIAVVQRPVTIQQWQKE